jgi:sugar lactone lactonase YvrE
MDAGVDAPIQCPQGAPVISGQAADLVLGQPNFTSNSSSNMAGSSMKAPNGVLAGDGRLWVGDGGNARVLQWSSTPAVNGQSANIALGQPDLLTTTPGSARDKFDLPAYFARSGTKLLVSDSSNNRVLVWNTTPTVNGQPADLVLGQPDFTTKTNGNSASSMYGPTGVWTDGTRLIVSDRFNNRVLIWNSFPTMNGALADVVLGAATFNTTPFVMPPTASSMRNPYGVTFDGTRLYVADQSNNRVLVWNAIPTANNAPADQVLGQGSFDASFNNDGAPYPQVNAIGMVTPSDVAVDACGAVYICDDTNGRVMVFTHHPTGNGPTADAVLGKPDLTTEPNQSVPISDRWMGSCRGLATSGADLYVSDLLNNRVLRFPLSR